MPMIRISCSLFDPVRWTTSAVAENFIVDTWFEYSLVTQEMYVRLPGVPTAGTGPVMMSSGMFMTRPYLQLGVQVNRVRAMPLRFYVVDNGPAPVLLGQDFFRALFEMGLAPPSPTTTVVTIEDPSKRAPDSLGVRLIPADQDTIQVRELERFISGVRRLHNCAYVTASGLHQHDDWPRQDHEATKRNAVRRTIVDDASLSADQRLTIGWVESGSVWLTLISGAKSGLSWLSQIFKLSMDARLERALATSATAKERVILQELTREDIARAKQAEQRLKTARANRQAREELRTMMLSEIDFRRAVAQRIQDSTVREEVLAQVDSAIGDLVTADSTRLLSTYQTFQSKSKSFYQRIHRVTSGIADEGQLPTPRPQPVDVCA